MVNWPTPPPPDAVSACREFQAGCKEVARRWQGSCKQVAGRWQENRLQGGCSEAAKMTYEANKMLHEGCEGDTHIAKRASELQGGCMEAAR